ncbi:MAG: hypothetical protein NVSMB18_30250 [Acetobacteraceae bacterium]
MSEPGSVLIGIVGYSPVVDAYPLGPRLMEAVGRLIAAHPHVAVENMTWSPLHIVQRFEDAGAVRPWRLVLVGAAAVSEQPGRVRAFRWRGGVLPAQAMQERVYEAVTGVVDLENTVMIGTHFKVWPQETFMVEIDLPADTFGRMVIADRSGIGPRDLADEVGFEPDVALAALAGTAVAVALGGEAAPVALEPKSASALVPVVPFTRTTIAASA